MVRKERLELSHLSILDPKSSASTNSATLALEILITPSPAQALLCVDREHPGYWGGRWGLNPRPPESQSGALPTELRPPLKLSLSPRGTALKTGTPDRNRTCNPRLRRPMLYPIELRALNSSVKRATKIGRGREIRTPDILLPKQARYQTALYPDLKPK